MYPTARKRDCLCMCLSVRHKPSNFSEGDLNGQVKRMKVILTCKPLAKLSPQLLI